jgi:hypothetical protein
MTTFYLFIVYHIPAGINGETDMMPIGIKFLRGGGAIFP